jgi:hypothetical protein
LPAGLMVSNPKGRYEISAPTVSIAAHWININNPDNPAIKREVEVDWSR